MKKSIKAVLSVLLAAVLMSCTLLSAALAADTVKRMSCTMIKSGAASRGFCWYTLEKSASDLQIVEESKYDGNFTSAATYTGTCSLYRGQYSHKVTVTDLKAGTLYFYRAGDASKGLWSETASFVTDDGDEKFSFITIADVQASSRENFEEAFITAESAYETMPDAGFMVNLGDYVNDNTNDEWDWYFDNFSFATNFSSVAATINNIGPGFEMVGPTGNFAAFSPLSKIVLTFDMLAGRLELFPMLILLYPQTWRKRG